MLNLRKYLSISRKDEKMKKRKGADKKKIVLIVTAVVVAITILLLVLQFLGIQVFQTVMGVNADKPTSYSNSADLESGKAYVWHHDGGKIEDDLSGDCGKDVFFQCVMGDYNFKGKEKDEVSDVPRTIWYDSSFDDKIPTIKSGDRLIYVSSTLVPTEITFERFADYGYTIGVANMVADGGNHYYIVYADMDTDDYKYYLDLKSDASQLAGLETITKLYLDKVGKIKVDEKSVSDGGTVLGLEKDKIYTCEFYTGTFYQDYKLTANIHTFSSMETFTSYDYEFMHSNFISITIPEYFKSGYYYVNGIGFFRFVAANDEAKYNGKAYDANINWNDPMLKYDEFGTVIYDPSDPDKSSEAKEEEIKATDDNGTSDPGVDNDEIINKEETKEEKSDERDGS